MSKRNFTLLILILLVAIAAVFAFFYFRKPAPNTGGETPGDNNFFSQFNPFGPGSGTKNDQPPVDVSGYVPPSTSEQKKLMKVSSMPVAGFGLFSKERLKQGETPAEVTEAAEGSKKPAVTPTEFAAAVRYAEKATGNIYQTFADRIEERKFSKTVIPRVYEAYFGSKDEAVVMRHLKGDDRTIETFAGTLPKDLIGKETAPDNEITGAFLPDNVKDISVSPDGLKIFYLFNDTAGENMTGTILNFSNNKKTQIFDSPFTEWASFWPNNNLITLTTKPSYFFPGYMYTINLLGQNLNKVLGNIRGLTTLGSPSGKMILYGDNTLSMFIYSMDNRNSTPVSLKTLPEKCVWGKVSSEIYCAVPKSAAGALYPDLWYQGEISFNDQIWKIDVSTGNTTLLIDPAREGGEEIDGIKLALDEAEDYLFFVNKKDSFLWKLDLK